MNRVKKAIHRLFKIVIGKKGIYGKTGHGNKYMKNVFLDEKSEIGNFNYFGENVHINNTKIGNYCSIASNVVIGPGNHDIENVSTCVRIMEKAGIKVNLLKNKTIIENDVWIGTNVVILQGVKVENGAVIAAGAVVTKNVPSYCVVGGVPARKIKYRFDNIKIKKIVESRWFEKDIEEARVIVKDLI